MLTGFQFQNRRATALPMQVIAMGNIFGIKGSYEVYRPCTINNSLAMNLAREKLT